MQQSFGMSFNPRRPPPHLSVSLKRQNENPVHGTHGDKSRTSKPISARQHSYESNSSSTANVEKWFDRTSRQPPIVKLPRPEDDIMSPCFVPETVSVLSNDFDMIQQIHPSYAQYREQTFQSGTGNSSEDGYRSVIDDLTIENKKLKEKLRKYEKLHGTPIERDKLFEVKIHALPPAKRRDLEDTLRNFASRIDGAREDVPKSKSKLEDVQIPTPDSDTKLAIFGSTGSRPGDSGYASMPNSGPTSTSTHNEPMRKKLKVSAQATQDEKIHSYLQDNPAGLLPKHSMVMTERQKKKMVVKRLEQLFTGKAKGVLACHNQTLQQQEVAKSAAKSDQASIRGNSEEGLREANILPHQADGDDLEPAGFSTHSSLDVVHDSAVPMGSQMHPPSSPEQRPTRPLDLDPDREQNPLDNMEYLHHMGVSTSQMMMEDLSDAEPEVDGWIFLNLLINMAQLHIMNVTPSFVRSAISDVSTKFQLSKDGQQVRWRGGKEGTRLSSDSDNCSSPGKRLQEIDGDNDSQCKRQRTDGQAILRDFARFAEIPERFQNQNVNTATKDDPFHYKPLFARAVCSDDDMSLGDGASSRGDLDSEDGACTGATQYAQLGRQQSTSSAPKMQRGDGPIAFYSGANFCTDLSSDSANIATPFHNMGIGKDGYSNHTDDALGCTPQGPTSRLYRSDSGSLLRFRPFKDYSISDPFQMSGSRTLSLVGKGNSNEQQILNMDMGRSSDKVSVAPVLDLHVSGLGGTQPADHFIYTVRTKRTKLNSSTPRKPSPPILNRTISATILKLFRDREVRQSAEDITAGMASMSTFFNQPQRKMEVQPNLSTEVLDVKFTQLPPSRLPEPSSYYEAMSTTDSDGSGDSEASSGSGLSRYRKPLALDHWPQVTGFGSEVLAETATSGESSEDEEESDGSIDMLAHLRAANPAAVAAQEAEFAMGIDGDGSAAATVGGRTVSESSGGGESGSEGGYESSG